jgi:hypothetical protein
MKLIKLTTIVLREKEIGLHDITNKVILIRHEENKKRIFVLKKFTIKIAHMNFSKKEREKEKEKEKKV